MTKTTNVETVIPRRYRAPDQRIRHQHCPACSLYQPHRSVQIVGVLTGLWLGSYSFIAPNVPEYVL